MTGEKVVEKKILRPEQHGTTTGYHYGCRCSPCCVAMREYQQDYLARKRSEPTPDDVHGTFKGYNIHACRCDECIEAWRAHYAPQKQATVDRRAARKVEEAAREAQHQEIRDRRYLAKVLEDPRVQAHIKSREQDAYIKGFDKAVERLRPKP